MSTAMIDYMAKELKLVSGTIGDLLERIPTATAPLEIEDLRAVISRMADTLLSSYRAMSRLDASVRFLTSLPDVPRHAVIHSEADLGRLYADWLNACPIVIDVLQALEMIRPEEPDDPTLTRLRALYQSARPMLNEAKIPLAPLSDTAGTEARDRLSPELRRIFDASWDDLEPAYRYLGR